MYCYEKIIVFHPVEVNQILGSFDKARSQDYQKKNDCDHFYYKQYSRSIRPAKEDRRDRADEPFGQIVCNDAYRDLEPKSEQATGDGFDRVSLIADNSRVNFL